MPVTTFDKMFAAQVVKHLSRAKVGFLEITLPDGTLEQFGDPRVSDNGNRAIIHDWGVFRKMLLEGSIGLTEAYSQKRLECSDLKEFIYFGLCNEQAVGQSFAGNPFFHVFNQFRYLWQKNTKRQSKRNIRSHYDLGNAFFQLWLDENMNYSSALYLSAEASLEDAQQCKNQAIIHKLERGSGRLLEIGSGWGAFAETAANQGDFAIEGITLSQEQFAYSRNRLGDRANFFIRDYRDQSGKFDSIVSIEMIEAVGEKYWPRYFSALKSLLSAKGHVVLQSIEINDWLFESYRRGSDMIRTYIFPGGLLLCPSALRRLAEQSGLRVVNRHDLTGSYVQTLKTWLERFDAKQQEVRALGFSDSFIKIWRFYLSACEAGFQSRRIGVFQTVLTH